MDDVLLAAIALVAGTDIAFSNGWRYGAPIPPGQVTLNDLWNIVPTNPPVSVVQLTGAEIISLLEESLEMTFSAKLENPKGHRIEQVFTREGRIDPLSTYPAAFITAQGVPESMGVNRRDLETTAIAALQAWFADPAVAMQPGPGRMRIV